jgi:hypothetical protein
VIARKLATTKRGGDRKSDQTANSQFDSITVAKAAELLNVGERGVYDAGLILDRGTKEEVAAVERGDAAAFSPASNRRRIASERLVF